MPTSHPLPIRRAGLAPLALALGLALIAACPAAPQAAAPEAAPASAPAALAEPAPADTAAAPAPAPIASWLVLGPVPAPLPAFADDKEKGYKVDDLAGAGALDPRLARRVRAGETVALPLVGPQAWRQEDAAALTLAPPVAGQPAEAYLATYLQASRWLPAELVLTAAHPVRVFLDGQEIKLQDGPARKEPAAAGAAGAAGTTGDAAAGAAASGTAGGDTDAASARRATCKLTPGKHLLLVRAVHDPAKAEPWRLTAAIGAGKGMPAEALAVSTRPDRGQNIHDVLDAPAITSAALSPDGKLVACSLAQTGPDGKRETWLEVRRAADGRLERSWRGGGALGRVRWAPDGRRLSYVTSREEKSSLWIHDLDGGATTRLGGEIDQLGDYRWSPDGAFVIYEFSTKPEPDKRKVKRLQNLADRMPDWRERTYLALLTVPDGATRRLTAGPWSTGNWRLSPDGGRLLFFREWPDYGARPYSRSELWELDLRTMAAQKILEDPWISAAEYGPDPGVLALQGSPSAFGGLGRDLPAGVVPNDYGGQLYLYDRASREATAASRELDPDIIDMQWHRHDGRIYARVYEGQRQCLYAFEPKTSAWRRLDAGCEVLDSFDLAVGAPLGIALGTGAVTPQRLSLVDLKRGQSRVILDPTAEAAADVRYGRVEDWACKLPNGETLDGRVYYPLDFDPSRRYPCIVYYYGGTTPVGRDFAGRYPKNLWAGLGYFVYVPQPSGALGYGQEFAARHVNDWGRLTAQEVIDGTQAFLAAHPNVDKSRLACMGASYGGFLTEYLVTRTDLFACAVSHAGISSISSYWGEGFWGYEYGARALANAFPWSDKDLYVGQSPLFSADKIRTPLLLLHGSVDTNVPPGESDQLYAALKLLGREVEYVRIEGQNHHILDRDQRLVWNDTILAYLAKWLKDEPQWWEEMYPQ